MISIPGQTHESSMEGFRLPFRRALGMMGNDRSCANLELFL